MYLRVLHDIRLRDGGAHKHLGVVLGPTAQSQQAPPTHRGRTPYLWNSSSERSALRLMKTVSLTS